MNFAAPFICGLLLTRIVHSMGYDIVSWQSLSLLAIGICMYIIGLLTGMRH